ncbi:response regulator transcription factor [Syntrophotalea carbinolica]|nr:response regulator transcription factor [Syntrophotalea carbinolica]
MEISANHEKNIWILAHQAQPDLSSLQDLMGGGYHLQPFAIRKSAVLHPPQKVDLALLDMAASTQDAMTSIMRLREDYKGPLAVLDNHPNERRHILALEIGADDYLQQPVSSPVLAARIEALLRRYQQAEREPSAVISVGDLTIDATRREVTKNEKVISVTTVEFKLLWYLASHAGIVVSRNDIHLALYNREYNGIDRSVDMYISRLRKKLGDCPAHPTLLKTIRGDGYLFVG